MAKKQNAVNDKNVLRNFATGGRQFFNKWKGACSIVGSFIGESEVRNNVGKGNKTVYEVLQDDGNPIFIDAGIGPLEPLFKAVKAGQRIRIVFDGMQHPVTKKVYDNPIPVEKDRVKIFGKARRGKSRAWMVFSTIQILKK
jgi:hypothetical protein